MKQTKRTKSKASPTRRAKTASGRTRKSSWWDNPTYRFSLISMGLISILFALIIWGTDFSIWGFGLAWFIALNVMTLFIYRYDKFIAGSRKTRIPEAVLLGLAFIGGTAGAYLAIYHFKNRHKAQKKDFVTIFWSIVVIHLLVISAYILLR